MIPNVTDLDNWKQMVDNCSNKTSDYEKLKQSLAFKPRDDVDPLAQVDDNPWDVDFRDQELKEIIWKDCERVFADDEWFRRREVQVCLKDVLFCWCKKVGFGDLEQVEYRQGMHEIAAVVMVAVQRSLGIPDEKFRHETIIRSEVEAITYYAFKSLMNSIKFLYSRTPNDLILNESRRVYDCLKIESPILYKHLIDLKIEPQIFCIRWLRLLFAREFTLDQTLIIWNSFIGDWELILYFAVSMLDYIQDEILQGDYTSVMQLFMKYPRIYDQEVLGLLDKAKAMKSGNQKKESRISSRLKAVIAELDGIIVVGESSLKLDSVKRQLIKLVSDLAQQNN